MIIIMLSLAWRRVGGKAWMYAISLYFFKVNNIWFSSSGWYFVEKVSDGLKGWIPDHICQEVESSHIRAKHFKQRYLFLKSLTSDSWSDYRENNEWNLTVILCSMYSLYCQENSMCFRNTFTIRDCCTLNYFLQM